ncbi:MAG: MoxR family ATPase [Clostridia bacterium]|nr:MoxR family ATPase [Clostridia bacterium]
MVNKEDINLFSGKCEEIFAQIKRDIVGQEDVVENTVIAMIAGGNVLLEGVPGIGKTRLVRSLGRVFSLPFSRIQFTPDLMPADVTGTNVMEKDAQGNAVYRFQPGPIFSNIVLADEINRATPKSQSALLEAMQEHTVTVSGEDHRLEEPFFVLATQNPIEQEGTYALPEAQMDRFMFKLTMQYPTVEEMKEIVLMTQKTMAEVSDSVVDGAQLLRMRETAKEIPVIDDIVMYTMRLVASTQPGSSEAGDIAKRCIRLGASPRAAQALITGAKVRAMVGGRYNVSYEDIDALAYPVLRHRIKLGYEALADRMTSDDVIGELLRAMKSGKKKESKR